MRDNTITDNEDDESPIETEQWEIALKPYATDADAAFDMARRLMEIKKLLQAQPPSVSLAKAALNDACELLFPFTEFRQAAYDLYLTFIEGTPTKAQEDILTSLLVKF
jgi:hypothetical protein